MNALSRYLVLVLFLVPIIPFLLITIQLLKRHVIYMMQTISKMRQIRVWTRDLSVLTQHNQWGLLCLRWRLRCPHLLVMTNQNERTCPLCPEIQWHRLRPSHKPALVSAPDDTIIIFKLIIYSLKQPQSLWGCWQNINTNIKINHNQSPLELPGTSRSTGPIPCWRDVVIRFFTSVPKVFISEVSSQMKDLHEELTSFYFFIWAKR